ncbi:hypothetical protein [Deinococcus roseus]|uniref:hypothetical protein n=1 Tax=Deinococcus roseus TaxID=392414 RepID=UPI001668626D|nr:hypothetical protein [Deinococcus roseus]
MHQLENQLQVTQLQAEKAEKVAELSGRIGALTQGIDNLALHLMQNPSLGAELAGLFRDLQTSQQDLEEARRVPIYPALSLHEDVTVRDLQDLLFLLTGTASQGTTDTSAESSGITREVEVSERQDPEMADPSLPAAPDEGHTASTWSEPAPETPVEPNQKDEPEPALPEIPEQQVDLQHAALPTPSLQGEVQRLLEALLPQPRSELLALMPRTAADWEQVDTHFKLRTLLSKLRLEQPDEEATAGLTRWYASFRHRDLQVLELIDPDLGSEKELAWLVLAAFLHSLHRWELPAGTGRYRVYFKNPRTCERIEQFLKHASTPVTVQELNRVLMLREDQLEAALLVLPFAKRLEDGRFVHQDHVAPISETPSLTVALPAAPIRDPNWDLILEVLDPRWNVLAESLASAGLPAPDDCHVDLHDGVQVTGNQALLLWTAQKVAVVENSEVTSSGHQTFSVQLPDLAGHLQKALHG